MTDGNAVRKTIYIRWLLLRLGMVVFDIIAVNAAYFLALLLRFYVNFEFNIWAERFVPAFFEFAPSYTVCCLVVFGLLGLYNRLWKYASISDLKRILLASAITCVIQIVGSITLVMRMPITYYGLGAIIQFTLLVLSRFSYRIIALERGNFVRWKKTGDINVLVVGTGETSRTVIKFLSRGSEGTGIPVCMVDFSGKEDRGILSGVPVIGGIDKISRAVEKYDVTRVILADSEMPEQMQQKVRKICRDMNVPVQNFSEYFLGATSKIHLRTLLELVQGPVELEIQDQLKRYDTAEQAAMENTERYIVTEVSSENGCLRVKLIRDALVPNDTQAEWIKTYRENTGEDISFF